MSDGVKIYVSSNGIATLFKPMPKVMFGPVTAHCGNAVFIIAEQSAAFIVWFCENMVPYDKYQQKQIILHNKT